MIHTFELERDPVIAVAGIHEERIAIIVAGVSAAYHLIDVLISVVVQISKRHAMTFL